MSAPVPLRFGPFSLLWRPRTAWVCAALAGLGLVLAIALLGTGTLSFTPAEIAAALFGKSGNAMAERVVWSLRLPRVVTAASLLHNGDYTMDVSRFCYTAVTSARSRPVDCQSIVEEG